MSPARQSIAITSDATVMSKPSSRGTPCALPPSPSTICLSCLSFISTALFQVICLGSMPSALPCCMWLSSMAASRLLAAPMAWKSPVKCRFISSIGTICAYPPPAAPPFMPNTGPRDGSLRAAITFFPILRSPSVSPTEVVVLPSPAGVGVMAVTSISLPSCLSFLSLSRA